MTSPIYFRSQAEISKGCLMEPFTHMENSASDNVALNWLICSKFEKEGMNKPFMLFEQTRDE